MITLQDAEPFGIVNKNNVISDVNLINESLYKVKSFASNSEPNPFYWDFSNHARPDVYDFYTKMLREQAVACVKDALRNPLEPVLKDGVMTICLYVLNCGFVTSDPIRLTYCVPPVTYLEDNLDKSKSELGMRLLYALEQSGQRISVRFTYPDDLEEDECDFISRYDGYDELVNALVDAVLERLMGHTGEIWD